LTLLRRRGPVTNGAHGENENDDEKRGDLMAHAAIDNDFQR
jgi:hypothetical protein